MIQKFYSKNKTFINIAIILVIIYVIYRVTRKDPYDVSDMPPRNTRTGSGGGSTTRKVCKDEDLNRDLMLYVGLKDSCEVKYLQRWLNTYYAEGLAVDGDFGQRTKAALERRKGQVGGTLNSLNI